MVDKPQDSGEEQRGGVCVLEPREWEEPRVQQEWNQVHLRSRQGEIRLALPQLCNGIKRKATGKSSQEHRAMRWAL